MVRATHDVVKDGDFSATQSAPGGAHLLPSIRIVSPEEGQHFKASSILVGKVQPCEGPSPGSPKHRNTSDRREVPPTRGRLRLRPHFLASIKSNRGKELLNTEPQYTNLAKERPVASTSLHLLQADTRQQCPRSEGAQTTPHPVRTDSSHIGSTAELFVNRACATGVSRPSTASRTCTSSSPYNVEITGVARKHAVARNGSGTGSASLKVPPKDGCTAQHVSEAAVVVSGDANMCGNDSYCLMPVFSRDSISDDDTSRCVAQVSECAANSFNDSGNVLPSCPSLPILSAPTAAVPTIHVARVGNVGDEEQCQFPNWAQSATSVNFLPTPSFLSDVSDISKARLRKKYCFPESFVYLTVADAVSSSKRRDDLRQRGGKRTGDGPERRSKCFSSNGEVHANTTDDYVPQAGPSVNNSVHAFHRNFGESFLLELCRFLRQVGEEVEEMAYRQVMDECDVAGGTHALPSFTDTEALRAAEACKSAQGNQAVRGPAVVELRVNFHDEPEVTTTPNYPLASVKAGCLRSNKAAQVPMALPYTDLADHVGLHSGLESLHTLNSSGFPFAEHNNNFAYADLWFKEVPQPPRVREAMVVVTAEPPLYLCGMLFDPVSGHFLLGGVAFKEEARVLRVTLPSPSSRNGHAHALSVNDCQRVGGGERTRPPISLNGSPECGNVTRPPTSGHDRVIRILFREYISISQAYEGCMLQTFSLLDEGAHTSASKHQILSPETVLSLLPHTCAGAVTRAFSLYHVARRKPQLVAKDQPQFLSQHSSTLEEQPTRMTSDEYNMSQLTGEGVCGSAGASSCDSPRLLSGRLDGLGGNGKSVKRCDSHRSTTSLDASRTRRSFVRQLFGEEARLRVENPTLFEWVVQQDPSELVEPIDNIKEFLLYFKQRYSFMMVMQQMLDSVRRIQVFFRSCLGKKRRALNRMLHLWRLLEVDSQGKLQNYHFTPSSMERIDLIAGSILQQHMLTTQKHKIALINEMWSKRRLAFIKWKSELLLDERIARHRAVKVARQREVPAALRCPTIRARSTPDEEGQEALGKSLSEGVHHVLRQGGELTRLPCASAASTAEEVIKLYDDFSNGYPPTGNDCATCLDALSITDSATGNAGIPNFLSFIKTRGLQLDDLHERFGWYIPPQELLYESHCRLLASLKSSVLTMEHVQYEVLRATEEARCVESADLQAPLDHTEWRGLAGQSSSSQVSPVSISRGGQSSM